MQGRYTLCTSTHYYSSSLHCLQHRHHPKYLHNHHNQAGGFEPCRGGTYIQITSSYLNSFHCLHHRHLPKYLYLIIISFIRFYLTPSVSPPAVLAMSLILSIEGDFVHRCLDLSGFLHTYLSRYLSGFL